MSDDEIHDRLDRLIDRWEEAREYGEEVGIPLREWLGMTAEQGDAFFRRGEILPGYTPPDRPSESRP